MKRPLLALLLAVVLMGVLAAPASAGKPVEGNWPPSVVPVLLPAFVYNGQWAYSTVEAPDAVPGVDVFLYQAADPGVTWPYEPNLSPEVPYRPIPRDQECVACIGWLGSIYGMVKDVPRQVQTTIEIIGPDGSSEYVGPAETAPYWSGPHVWDQWWTDWLNYAFSFDPPLTDPWTPFNPRIQAGVYWNHLYVPVGPFTEPGLYTMYVQMTQSLPVNDLMFFDPEYGPWPHGVFKRGWLDWSNSDWPYTFYVE